MYRYIKKNHIYIHIYMRTDGIAYPILELYYIVSICIYVSIMKKKKEYLLKMLVHENRIMWN